MNIKALFHVFLESKAVPTQKIKQDEKVDYGMKNTGKLHGGFRQEVYHCNTTGNEFINEGDVYGEVLQNLWGCDSGFKCRFNFAHIIYGDLCWELKYISY